MTFASHYTVVSTLLAVVLLSGCEQRAGALTPDGAIAEIALKQALDAWQNGDSASSLAVMSPPLTFNDRQWNAGAKLVSYSITGSPVITGNTQLFQVELETEEAGKSQSATVPYLVYQADAMSISRVEE